MAASSASLANSRLRKLAQRSTGDFATTEGEIAAGVTEAEEHCELCNAPIPRTHRHLLELSSRELMCACRPCSLLFDRDGSGNGQYRLVPERRLRLDDFALSDLTWEELRIPVDMAFFFYSSAQQRVLAYYPGPMGPTESQLELGAWREIEQANPILAGLEEDVEALLVNRIRGARRQWLVPLDDCYGLVGLIRMHWRGLTGGKAVWQQIDGFFAELDSRARGAAGRT